MNGEISLLLEMAHNLGEMEGYLRALKDMREVAK